MKPTKSQAQKIADNYSLGKVKSIKLIPQGLINYNFNLKTEKGNYILQIITTHPGGMLEKFRVMSYLKKHNFKYEVPIPLKNNEGRYLLRFKKNALWVYKRIEGLTHKNSNLEQFKQVARALAAYHKQIKSLRGKGTIESPSNPEHIKILKKIRPNSKVNKIIFDNKDLLHQLLEKARGINNKGQMIWRHNDLHEGNLIFRKGKVKGIIDFGNLRYSTVAGDIAIAIKRTRYKRRLEGKINVFLKEYKKYNNLSKASEGNIIKEMAGIHFGETMWLYRGLKKTPHLKEKFLKGAIKGANEILRLN